MVLWSGAFQVILLCSCNIVMIYKCVLLKAYTDNGVGCCVTYSGRLQTTDNPDIPASYLYYVGLWSINTLSPGLPLVLIFGLSDLTGICRSISLAELVMWLTAELRDQGSKPYQGRVRRMRHLSFCIPIFQDCLAHLFSHLAHHVY